MRLNAAIVDMDGTLVNVSSVRHHVVVAAGVEKDFVAFHEASRQCPPHEQALEFCRRHYAAGNVIVVLTARMDRHLGVSKGWLDEFLLPELLRIPRPPHLPVGYDGPLMREDGLRYSDTVIKRRLHTYLTKHYNIVAACDDRPEIVQLWHDLAIPEIEVIPGWID